MPSAAMPHVSLNTAISITGLSRRTLWRRIADGSLRAEAGAAEAGQAQPGGQTRVVLADVLVLSPLVFSREEQALIADADAGAADAQCQLALCLLQQDQAEAAVAWLQRAAQSFYPEALHWLGRCAIAGHGMAADEKAGLDWIAQAARRGHSLAAELLRYLESPDRPELAASVLDLKLDELEQEVVRQALQAQFGHIPSSGEMVPTSTRAR